MPRISEIHLAIKNNMCQELSVFSHHVLRDDIVNIDDNSRATLVQTLPSKGRHNHITVVNFLRKGFPLKEYHFKDITSGED